MQTPADETNAELCATVHRLYTKVAGLKEELEAAEAASRATVDDVQVFMKVLRRELRLPVSEPTDDLQHDLKELLYAAADAAAPPVPKRKAAGPAVARARKKPRKAPPAPARATSVCVQCSALGDDDTMALCDRCDLQGCLDCTQGKEVFHCPACLADVVDGALDAFAVEPSELWGNSLFAELSQSQRAISVKNYPDLVAVTPWLKAKSWKNNHQAVRRGLYVHASWASGRESIESLGELLDHHPEVVPFVAKLLQARASAAKLPGSTVFFSGLVSALLQ